MAFGDYLEIGLHLVTALTVFIPAFFLYKMASKDKDPTFKKVFLAVLLGSILIAIKHLLEALSFFGITFMAYGTSMNFMYDHFATISAFVLLGWFFYWFDKKFVAPLYG